MRPRVNTHLLYLLVNQTPRLGRILGGIIAACMFPLVIAGCQAPPQETSYRPCAKLVSESAWRTPHILNNSAPVTFDALVNQLMAGRVILLGEHHDRYDHHLSQLELICRLHARHPRLAIGVEFVQQPFQTSLDDFVQQRIDESTFLRRSEYFARWGFDYRLYAPILRFARDNTIPVIALNVPGEVTAKIARQGMAALSDEERQWIPANGLNADDNYRERLRAVFDAHADASSSEFENFLKAQILWDEVMAKQASGYLADHDGVRLVIIAGNGHVAYQNAIAGRIGINADSVIIVSQDQSDETQAHYELRSTELALPAAGRLGVLLDTTEEGVRIESFTEDSAARSAGINTGDFIVRLDDEPVSSYADVKLVLWPKTAGEQVTVGVSREDQHLSYEVTLR